jgi:serine O-acetyltransferase
MENISSNKKCNCLGCGDTLVKNDSVINYCEDCFVGMKFDLKINKKEHVFEEIEQILKYFTSDVTTAFRKDPAAKSLVEVLTSYPGIQAVLIYRVAHFLWEIGLPFVPRYLSNIARQLTGIDIHPGAHIGQGFFIDHGQGVVIGETTIIGNHVTVYQGVTLGGISLENKKRHPTLGDNIIIGAGAKILGPVHIGNNVKIGANSVVTDDIPDNCVAVGVPARIIKGKKSLSKDITSLLHGNLPDPILKYISTLEAKLDKLEKRMDEKGQN